MSCLSNVVRILRARGVIVLLLFLTSLLLTLPASGQEAVRVDGRVLNSEGAPLAGATVRIVGSGVDAITRGDGTFTLPRVSPGTYTLLIERLGYAQETQSVSVDGEPQVITVMMNSSALEIGGLLVTGTLS